MAARRPDWLTKIQERYGGTHGGGELADSRDSARIWSGCACSLRRLLARRTNVEQRAVRHQVSSCCRGRDAERHHGAALQGARRGALPGPRARRGLSVGAAHGGYRIDRGARVRRGADDRGLVVAVRSPHVEITGVRTAVPVFGSRSSREVPTYV